MPDDNETAEVISIGRALSDHAADLDEEKNTTRADWVTGGPGPVKRYHARVSVGVIAMTHEQEARFSWLAQRYGSKSAALREAVDHLFDMTTDT